MSLDWTKAFKSIYPFNSASVSGTPGDVVICSRGVSYEEVEITDSDVDKAFKISPAPLDPKEAWEFIE